MSEEETYAAQGRAHARLKSLTSEIATVKAELIRRNRDLTTIAGMIELFIQEPERRNSGAPEPFVASLAKELNRADLPSIEHLAHELFQKTIEARILEEQVKKF